MESDVSPAQIRGARGMLDWSMLDLATTAGVSVSSVKRMERTGQSTSKVIEARVRVALGSAGARFTRGMEGEEVRIARLR